MDETFTPRVTVLLAHALRLSDWNHHQLAAPHWRFYWNRGPGSAVTLNGQSTQLEPGHILIIPPETPFSSGLHRPVEHLFLHFVLEPLGATAPAVLSLPTSRNERERLGAIMDLFLSDQPRPVSIRLECMALIHRALAVVPEKWLEPVRLDPRVAGSIIRMESNLAAPLRNDVLARGAHMNTNAFIRLFSKQTGMGPQEFLTVKRIERACGLLHSPTASIKEIAELMGFCDRYHFTRVFHRLRGIPPAEFRRRVCQSG